MWNSPDLTSQTNFHDHCIMFLVNFIGSKWRPGNMLTIIYKADLARCVCFALCAVSFATGVSREMVALGMNTSIAPGQGGFGRKRWKSTCSSM